MSRWTVLSSFVFLALCSACSSSVRGGDAPQSGTNPGGELLAVAERLAQSGQGSRAEQYYLAAVRAGVDWERAFPQLVELCVASGRLRSALSYVSRSRKLRPEDPELLQLSASLHWALGQESLALRDAEVLSGLRPLPAEIWFFLAEFALETERPDAARGHLERYLALRPSAEDAPWARVTLRRLEAQTSGDRSGAVR